MIDSARREDHVVREQSIRTGPSRFGVAVKPITETMAKGVDQGCTDRGIMFLTDAIADMSDGQGACYGQDTIDLVQGIDDQGKGLEQLVPLLGHVPTKKPPGIGRQGKEAIVEIRRCFNGNRQDLREAILHQVDLPWGHHSVHDTAKFATRRLMAPQFR